MRKGFCHITSTGFPGGLLVSGSFLETEGSKGDSNLKNPFTILKAAAAATVLAFAVSTPALAQSLSNEQPVIFYGCMDEEVTLQVFEAVTRPDFEPNDGTFPQGASVVCEPMNLQVDVEKARDLMVPVTPALEDYEGDTVQVFKLETSQGDRWAFVVNPEALTKEVKPGEGV
jgi:hypothetical protein